MHPESVHLSEVRLLSSVTRPSECTVMSFSVAQDRNCFLSFVCMFVFVVHDTVMTVHEAPRIIQHFRFMAGSIPAKTYLGLFSLCF